MNDVNCYERLVTAALASLLGVCAFLATANGDERWILL